MPELDSGHRASINRNELYWTLFDGRHMSAPLKPLIRFGLVTDQQCLESLQLQASLANPGDRDAVIANPGCIEVPKTQLEAEDVLVLERGDVILGFASVIARSDGNQELDALFVEPAHWKSGYGRLLVEATAELARARGAGYLLVVGNAHAIGFYEKCGFVFQSDFRTRFGRAPLLRRQLTG